MRPGRPLPVPRDRRLRALAAGGSGDDADESVRRVLAGVDRSVAAGSGGDRDGAGKQRQRGAEQRN
jgi:hypothetical protein